MKKIIDKLPFAARWGLALRTLPFIAAIVVIKFIVHQYGFEFLNLSSLFTAIISANIFLIGFLITGVLSDYKESEKIPSDLASAVETMIDEGLILEKTKGSKVAKDYLSHMTNLIDTIIDWFNKEVRTNAIMDKLTQLNNYFLEFESITQANFIVRLKQEQNVIRKLINRIHTIRETSFLGTGYAIVEIITTILVTGLIFIKLDPFYEGIFFVSFVSFMLIYMVYFIKDLDNPFGYSDKNSVVENVSLKPILDLQKRMGKISKLSE